MSPQVRPKLALGELMSALYADFLLKFPGDRDRAALVAAAVVNDVLAKAAAMADGGYEN